MHQVQAQPNRFLLSQVNPRKSGDLGRIDAVEFGGMNRGSSPEKFHRTTTEMMMVSSAIGRIAVAHAMLLNNSSTTRNISVPAQCLGAGLLRFRMNRERPS